MARHNELGVLGEKIAGEYMQANGYTIVQTNYRKSYGEIDIVSRLPGQGLRGQGETGGLTVFVEVKSVSYGTLYRAEENLHPQKLKRLANTIQAYLASHLEVGDWRFDVITVTINSSTRKASIGHLKDIILGA